MVVLGTYNMSFAGDAFPDKMPPFPSEYSFHARDTKRPRTFWSNAKNHLSQFIKEKSPLAVGLQEMNLSYFRSGTGVDAVHKMLEELEDAGKDYKMISREVPKNTAGISLIINTKEAGDISAVSIQDNAAEDKFKGRPILMVLTDKNYLFVSMHGMQDAGNGRYYKEFNKDMTKWNKEKFQEQVNAFTKGKKVDAVYIMGDFNDRFDAIKEFKFEFTGEEPVNYQGDSPKSCCHNWDSMGTKTTLIAEQDGSNYVQGLTANEIDQKKKTQSTTAKNPFKPGVYLTQDKEVIPDEHGITINHYINKGDKVFAWPNSGSLKIYKSGHNLDDKGVSIASDHELVYMDTEDAADAAPADAAPADAAPDDAAPDDAAPDDVQGGKRSKRKTTKKNRKTKSKKNSKKRKSLKKKKSYKKK